MTIAELMRAEQSYKRVELARTKERAAMDYILADLIGRSISRIHSSTAKMPKLHEAYPSLFNSDEIEEKIQEKKDEMWALKFRQFANAHNKKMKGVEAKNERTT